MGKGFSFDRVTTVWALLLGTIALLSVLVGLGIWISDNSANVASWVQAVGSIAAILAGFGIAQYQFVEAARREHEKNVEAERVLLRAKCLAFGYRLRLFSGWSKTLTAHAGFYGELWVSWEVDAIHLLEQLGAISVAEFPYPETAHEMSILRARLMAVVQTLRLGTKTLSAGKSQAEISKELAGWARVLTNHTSPLAEYSQALSDRYLSKAAELSTDTEREQVTNHQRRVDAEIRNQHVNSSDNVPPQTQPPAAADQ